MRVITPIVALFPGSFATFPWFEHGHYVGQELCVVVQAPKLYQRGQAIVVRAGGVVSINVDLLSGLVIPP